MYPVLTVKGEVAADLPELDPGHQQPPDKPVMLGYPLLAVIGMVVSIRPICQTDSTNQLHLTQCTQSQVTVS